MNGGLVLSKADKSEQESPDDFFLENLSPNSQETFCKIAQFYYRKRS
jgi:hypothetical protein